MTLTTEKIGVAIVETKRFLKKAKAAKKRLSEDSLALISGSKETAAMKRASMDLSRALTEIRR
jgi:hypothetical protein